jgi:hypothetical protein
LRDHAPEKNSVKVKAYPDYLETSLLMDARVTVAAREILVLTGLVKGVTHAG